MDDRPPIFLASAAAVRAVKKGNARDQVAATVGPGDHWSIQCRPALKRGEMGRGIVWALAPDPDSLDRVKRSRMSLDEYRRRYLEAPAFVASGPNKTELVPRCLSPSIAPGRLVGKAMRGVGFVQLKPGDTLTCCCSRADAVQGLCHRVWAAYLLSAEGWLAILDGEPVVPEHAAELLDRAPEEAA